MKALLMAAALAAACPAVAKDLGTMGQTFPIDEPSLIEIMVARAAKIDWNAKAMEFAQAAEYGLHNYAWAGLTPARETRTTYVDPSVVLQQAIQVPVAGPDGRANWKTLYPAGTRVNPLTKLRPPTRLLVFDPRNEDQVAFAVASLHAWPRMMELMVSGGDLKGMAEKVGRPVFYANAAIVQRFGLRHTPSLIAVGQGVHEFDLAITEFGPADVRADRAPVVIRQAWYGLPDAKMAVRK